MHLTKSIFLSLVLGLPAFCADTRSPLPGHPDLRFDFALIGDTGYSDQQVTNEVPNLIDEMNRFKLAFVVHDGDIKAGAMPCTDAIFEQRFRLFQNSRHPLIYLFGDNEWSDCGNHKEQPFDPLERLERLRSMFCSGDQSLGRRTLTLERQSNDRRFGQFRENVRWDYGNILFVGLNVPGAINNFNNKKEFTPRNAANLAWIKEAFALATRENYRALMFILQANPNFDAAPNTPKRAGFNDMLKLLEEETIKWGKQVVFVHGDTHYFRIDQPLVSSVSKRRIENFTRVETYGNPDMHWLRVSVDWRDPNVFTFRPMHVKQNLVDHTKRPATAAPPEVH